ncbi:T9SS type A sorting domain-containing protein [Hymenobacter aerilatus]|uniref:T9SS type A sorting domain-containing protein n=1 Tax=Hymenobacter aerilatus TaxID=2932251 RepID=A0A8T9SWS8_9BACT|nr:T9SS type A sorting domain-containing protein [Hymenobacter aerilatus]UOR05183.1 T9SS type A sorting domain-containing protein [Hymenobacter aerilatus]
MNRFLLFLFVIAGPLVATAQNNVPFGLVSRPDLVKIVHGTETLPNAWVGGLNSPQFSAIDLNGDQQPDLYLFDRVTNRSLTFLNVAAPGGGRRYQYAPEYEALFPSTLVNWVLLRDYDCDGRPDLFTSRSGNIAVYRNVAGSGGRPDFQLVSEQLSFFNTPTLQGNILPGGYNMPALQDVDGDGRLDIVTFDFVNSAVVQYYRNSSPEPCGGLQFRLEAPQWGGFASCAVSCTSFTFNNTYCRPAGTAHTGGHNITLLDLDGDGDQDALVGRDYCAELVSLRNDGTKSEALMSSASLSSSFPSGTTPVRVANFPTAYHLDVNFDGRPDLVVTPSVFDNQDTINTTQSVAFYENTSTGAVPNFAYRQNDFLQRGMIDTGEGAAPTFADIDGDGLLDMLVGSTNRNGAKGFFRASLTYYRNVGTATQPTFQLMTKDYLNLSMQRYAGIRPLLTDLNQDGRPDLALMVIPMNPNGTPAPTSQLRVLLNTAPAGQPAAFNNATAQVIQNLPNYIDDAPCFTDVDGDGRLDLLIGTNINDQAATSLRYYRNTGAANLSQAFALVNADFGQLRSPREAPLTNRPYNVHPAVADFDNDGQPDLLVTDSDGRIRLFSNYRAQQGAFTPLSETFYNELLGRYQQAWLGQGTRSRLAPAVADLNGDQRPELFIGLESGGIVAYAMRGTVVTDAPTAPTLLTAVQLYPNPARGTATLESPDPVRVSMFDVTGRLLYRSASAARTHQLDLHDRAAGVYVVQAETLASQRTTRRLVVQ